MSFKFVLDSDMHYGIREGILPREIKENNPEKIANMTDIDFAIVAGDLTDNGYDGKGLCCYKWGGSTNQLSELKHNYVNVIEGAGIPVKLCVGNHDRGKPPYWYQPVFDYVAKHNSGIRYTFTYENFLFICCGKYPNRIKWLKKQLVPEVPTIIFFHYNLQGNWSDWWSENQKEDFYQAIKDYNIKGILVGHHHISKISYWEGIRVISAAGPYVAVVECDEDDIVDITFR